MSAGVVRSRVDGVVCCFQREKPEIIEFAISQSVKIVSNLTECEEEGIYDELPYMNRVFVLEQSGTRTRR